MADQDKTAPSINPSGPWGQSASDQREWDAMKAKQQASQQTQSKQGAYSNGTDFHGNNN